MFTGRLGAVLAIVALVALGRFVSSESDAPRARNDNGSAPSPHNPQAPALDVLREVGRVGDWDRTIDDCTEAIRHDPKDNNAYLRRGVAYERKGDCDKAIDDCTEAIRLDPQSALAHYNRGWAYARRGEWGKAETDFAAARRLGHAGK